MKIFSTRNIIIAVVIIAAIFWYKNSQAKKNKVVQTQTA